MKFKIIFEDKDIIVCYKPPGVATQTKSLGQQDMVTLLKNYLSKSGSLQDPYLGLIHRLDQPVSGLLIFAKNKKSASILSSQLQSISFHKQYLALCSGIPVLKEGTLTHYHRKNPSTGLAIIEERVDNRKENKLATLDYKVIKDLEDAALLSINLKTGRFHQIRAQFSYIGHPLLGDRKYGNEISWQLAARYSLTNIALCAHKLTFIHPSTKEEMTFTQSPDWIDELYRGHATKI